MASNTKKVMIGLIAKKVIGEIVEQLENFLIDLIRSRELIHDDNRGHIFKPLLGYQINYFVFQNSEIYYTNVLKASSFKFIESIF